jgi:copper resistance protein D
VNEALVLCRLLQFAAAMLLFGAAVFQAALAPPALAGAIHRPLRRMAAAAILVVAATACFWLSLTAGQMGDGWADAYDPETIRSVLIDTQFGRVWLWRLALAFLLLGLLALGRHDRWPMLAVLAALVLGSLGLVGHAAMHTGPLGWLNRLSHIVHLLAAGFWLGSLPPLLVCLRRGTATGLAPDVAAALSRFSRLGHPAVALVLATGMINTWLVLGTWPMHVGSPYQALLMAKVGLVTGMIGLALVNRYRLVPRLPKGDGVRMLRLNTLGEVLLGLGAVGLVSDFATLAPL